MTEWTDQEPDALLEALKKRKMPEYDIYSCEEVGKAWQKLRKRIQNGQKLEWTGPDRLHHAIAATSPPPSHYLTKKGRAHDKDQGRNIWDTLFLIAFQIGFHNGTVKEETHGTNFYKRMYEADRATVDTLLKLLKDDETSEDKAVAGEVWQEVDNVILLCVEPGVSWRDFNGESVPWDAPTIARPLRRLLDSKGARTRYNDPLPATPDA